VLILQEFEFSIDDLKGTENKVADALSRQPVTNCDPSLQEVSIGVCIIRHYSKEDLGAWQQGDGTIRETPLQLRKDPLEIDQRKRNQPRLFAIKDGVLYRKGKGSEREFKLVVPSLLRREIIRC